MSVDIPYKEIFEAAKEINKQQKLKHKKTITLFFLIDFSIIIFNFILLYCQNYFQFFKKMFFSLLKVHVTEIKFESAILNGAFLCLIIVLILVVIFILLLIYYVFKKLWRMRAYRLNFKKLKEDWNFHGVVISTFNGKDEILEIKSSELGLIIKSRSWTDYKMVFDFILPLKISYGEDPVVNQLERGFSIIFRAKDLDEYYMLKIDKDGYKLHIRNKQYWEVFGPVITTEKFEDPDNLDIWVHAEVEVKDSVLHARIGKDQFSFPLCNFSQVKREYDVTQVHENKPVELPLVEIAFRSEGTVGFRSAPLEEVHIKNLKIIPTTFFFNGIFAAQSLLMQLVKIVIDFFAFITPLKTFFK